MRETSSKDSRPRRDTATAPQTTSPRRRKSTKKMNAENYATVEVKRKAAKDEARYDLAERGESKQRNFEKPDKPDDKTDSDGKHVADTLSSLPREDLQNLGLLMLLCTSPLRDDS
jgi:hypothetical protein